MGIEKNGANTNPEDFFELGKGKSIASDPDPGHKPGTATTTAVNTNGKGRKSRRRHPKKAAVAVAMAGSPVQKLYDACKEVFAFGGTGVVPSPESIERIAAILDDIKPADVGLHPDMPHFRRTHAGRTPAIRYLHLYENNKFSMGIFCLPPSAVIPLHNHPGMTVFSKLLFGTMHIKSYDWVTDSAGNTPAVASTSQAEQPDVTQPEVRLAKVKVDSDFTAPCKTSILYPADGGNMHCFTAVTPCAVLDVLGPPYSDIDGRHCTYYVNFPFADYTADGISVREDERGMHAWLQEVEKPEDLSVLGEMYAGPRLVE